MNKTTIITDTITYIEDLKTTVEELSNQLLQMEATSFGEEKIKLKEIDDDQDIKWGIKVTSYPYIHHSIFLNFFFNKKNTKIII